MSMNSKLPFKSREEIVARLKGRKTEFVQRLKANLEKIKARDEAEVKQGKVRANG